MKLSLFPLLSAYCGGQSDESCGIGLRAWDALDYDLPENEEGATTPEEAAAAEAQLSARGAGTRLDVWDAGYRAMDVCQESQSVDYIDPVYPLAWAIAGRFF